jgi:hypothetical protein
MIALLSVEVRGTFPTLVGDHHGQENRLSH